MEILNELREREHTLLAILNNSPSVLSLKDSDGVYRVLNPNIENILGYKKENILGKTDFDVFPPDCAQMLRNNDDKVRKDLKKISFEEIIQRSDGSELIFMSHKFPVFDPDGNFKYICSISIDITETRKAEKRLRESEAKFAAMFRNFPFAVTLINLPDLTYADVNPAFTEMFGYTREDTIGKTSVEIGIQYDHETREKMISEFTKKGVIRNFEVSARTKSGNFLFLSVTLDTIEINDKKYVLGTTQDITGKKLVEEKLQMALASSQMGLWHIDLRANQVTLSPELKKILEIPEDAEDLASINKRLIHPDDFNDVEKEWRKAVTEHKPYSKEYRIKRPSGEIRWILSTGLAKYLHDGTPISLSGITMDITEKKHSELALQSALKSRDEFLSIASHELKTPLTSLLMHAQFQKRLSKKGAPEAYDKLRIDDSSNKIEKLVHRLNRLVDDMLDISRIRTGKLSFQMKKIDLAQVINEVITRMEEIYSAEAGPIKYEGPEKLMCLADQMRIDQVISNILQNAIKYGEAKPIDINLTHTAVNTVIISITDNGIGISKENQQKIFGLFERAVSAYEISGMGLGLFISREIIKAHHGRIWVESVQGEGSTFYVELPLNNP